MPSRHDVAINRAQWEPSSQLKVRIQSSRPWFGECDQFNPSEGSKGQLATEFKEQISLGPTVANEELNAPPESRRRPSGQMRGKAMQSECPGSSD
jgi:hypothetical protein